MDTRPCVVLSCARVNKPHRFGFSFLTVVNKHKIFFVCECWAALCLYLCRCSHSPLMDQFLCVCVSLRVWKRLFQQASVEWIRRWAPCERIYCDSGTMASFQAAARALAAPARLSSKACMSPTSPTVDWSHHWWTPLSLAWWHLWVDACMPRVKNERYDRVRQS